MGEKKINRKSFLKQASVATAGLMGLTSCKVDPTESADTFLINKQKTYRWKMVTTWPPNFPVLGTGCINFANWVNEMSGGQMEIKVYGGGELIPALECFDAVSGGMVEMANGASYYWAGRAPAASFFTSVPFGMNAQQMNAWLYYGGGIELWRELYERYGLYVFPGGNTGVQMAGWFNRKIEQMADFKGLKMRIPGIGAKVLEKAGGTPVLSAGSEIYTNLERGVIDATEWIGPYHDYIMGFHEIAQYYYAPGWHETGSTLEFMINRKAFFDLPGHLQAIIETACSRFNVASLSEFEAKNNEYLQKMIVEHQVNVLAFPDEVIEGLRDLTRQTLEEMVAEDEFTAKVYASYTAFKKKINQWAAYSEKLYYDKL